MLAGRNLSPAFHLGQSFVWALRHYPEATEPKVRGSNPLGCTRLTSILRFSSVREVTDFHLVSGVLGCKSDRLVRLVDSLQAFLGIALKQHWGGSVRLLTYMDLRCFDRCSMATPIPAARRSFVVCSLDHRLGQPRPRFDCLPTNSRILSGRLHRTQFGGTVWDGGLSNFSNLTTYQDCSGDFDLTSVACALRHLRSPQGGYERFSQFSWAKY